MKMMSVKATHQEKIGCTSFFLQAIRKKTAISCITLHCFSVLITYCKPYRSFEFFCRPPNVLCLNILRKKSNHSMHFFFNLACGSYLTTKMTSSMHSFPNFPIGLMRSLINDKGDFRSCFSST